MNIIENSRLSPLLYLCCRIVGNGKKMTAELFDSEQSGNVNRMLFAVVVVKVLRHKHRDDFGWGAGYGGYYV